MAARGSFVKHNLPMLGKYQNACLKYFEWPSIVFIGWILLHMKCFMPFSETNMAAWEQLLGPKTQAFFKKICAMANVSTEDVLRPVGYF